MQGVGDAGQRLPGDDRAGFHPWLTLTAVAAAAARSQPGGAHKARRDGPEQVRSTLVAARPPRRTHWTKGAPRPQVLARARPARCRIGPDRRDHAQAVCCPNSPPSPHFNAHADHAATTASHLAIDPRARRRRAIPGCAGLRSRPTGIGRLNPPHYARIWPKVGTADAAHSPIAAALMCVANK